MKEICLISCKSTIEFLVECLLLSFWKIILFSLNRRVEACWSFLVFLPFLLEHCFYFLSVFCFNSLLLFYKPWHSVSSVQLLSHFRFFVTPWTAACQASLSITNSQSLLKLMSIESVMPSNHLILCCPLLLPSIFPSIWLFSNESVLLFRWPKYWSSHKITLNVSK